MPIRFSRIVTTDILSTYTVDLSGLASNPHLRQDRDLDRENRGVTFVFLRKL